MLDCREVQDLMCIYELSDLYKSPKKVNFSSGTKISPRLWNQNVHYRVHKRQQIVSILNQNNPFQFLSLEFNYLFKYYLVKHFSF